LRVLATYSIKGGVGKTTSAVNLAYEAAQAGARVLVWDLDPQGAATFYFRVRARLRGGTERLAGQKGELEPHLRATDVPSVHLIPADFSLRLLDVHLRAGTRPTERLAALLSPLDGCYDVAFLDCPPSISLASESVFAAAWALLVPVVARTLAQLIDFLDDRTGAPTVLPHFTMVDRRKKLHREQLEALRAAFPEFLETTIPNATAVERMGVERAPLGAYAPASPAARSFRALWAEMLPRLWPDG
jgi:chromosome partitioning protein